MIYRWKVLNEIGKLQRIILAQRGGKHELKWDCSDMDYKIVDSKFI